VPVELMILLTEGCPNAPILEERLAAVLAGRPGVRVRRKVITDEDQAARWEMRGSPALLVDGADPFAAPGIPPGLSCRIYRDEHGRADEAPLAAALRRVLAEATDG
jgi:hypothetical protein